MNTEFETHYQCSTFLGDELGVLAATNLGSLRGLGDSLGTPGGSLGGSLGFPGGSLGCPWGSLGGPWGSLGRPWGSLEDPWGVLEPPNAPRGRPRASVFFRCFRTVRNTLKKRMPWGALKGPNSFRRGHKTVPGGPWGVLARPWGLLGAPGNPKNPPSYHPSSG